MTICRAKNKPSEAETKESILRIHLTPAFGKRRLDQIRYVEIQDYAARKTKTLSPKTVNNHLTVVRRLLIVAKNRGLIEAVPEIEWLKVPRPDFDFLTFDGGARLVGAADPGWPCMAIVAMKTGLRQGELLALRWEDIALVAGLLRVRRSVTRGVVTVPKSGKGREVPSAMRYGRPSRPNATSEVRWCSRRPMGGGGTRTNASIRSGGPAEKQASA